jgi:hypothetical protein
VLTVYFGLATESPKTAGTNKPFSRKGAKTRRKLGVLGALAGEEFGCGVA